MAGNDLDHVIHVIYEKFTENQKNKKYEDRIYMAEEEFKHDLKEFVKKSEIEDKGLLISEIYRSISEDVLEVSSDGKITVSPKLLRIVENKIIARKEQEESLNNKKKEQTIVNENDNIDTPKMTSEQFKKLSFDQKVEIVSKTMQKFAKKLGVEISKEDVECFIELGEKDLSEILSNDPEVRKNQVFEMLGGDTSLEDSVFMEFGYTLYDTRKSLLENSPCSKLFIIDGKFDVNLFNYVMDTLVENNTRSIEDAYLDACKICGYEESKARSILEESASKGLEGAILQSHMLILVDSQAQIKQLNEYAELYKNKSPEEREQIDKVLYQMIETNRNARMASEKENVSIEELEKAAIDFNEQRISFKTRDMEQAIENRKKTKKVNKIVLDRMNGIESDEELTASEKRMVERMERYRDGSVPKRVVKNFKVKTFTGPSANKDKKTIVLRGASKVRIDSEPQTEVINHNATPIVNNVENEVSLDDNFEMEVSDFELGALLDMAEDMQVDEVNGPVAEHQNVPVEPTPEPVVVQNDNNGIHAETITVAKPDEKVAQQVVEQVEERKDESVVESNLPKEVTWVDRAKQGLFKFGKTLSNVVKAVTSKDKSKGLFDRIAEAINSEDTSSSDTTNSSGTSSAAGPGVDEKSAQNHVDYLNTQFKIDVKQAADSAKAAAEANKGITAEDPTHDDELV